MSSPLIADPELYRYGVHWKDFTVNATVGPGTYHIILKFNETQYSGPNQRGITIFVNGKKMIDNLDVFATAGGSNKAADIILNDISPQSGVIAIRFLGCVIHGIPREAIVQAIEIGPGEATGGMQPKSINVLQSR